jgi:hypothetical protein
VKHPSVLYISRSFEDRNSLNKDVKQMIHIVSTR